MSNKRPHPLLKDFLNGYVMCMLWANTMVYDKDDELVSEDACELRDQVSKTALEKAEEHCLDFLHSFTLDPDEDDDLDPTLRREWTEITNIYATAGDIACLGHYFALARNGHGAGFFDLGKGYPAVQRHARKWGTHTWIVDLAPSFEGEEVVNILEE
jgi:hypothetical protein